MKMKSILVSLLAAASMAVGVGAANADTLANIKSRQAINIGVDVGQAPFGMVDGQMKQVGSDVATAQQLASDLGVTLNIVPVAPANRIPFLMTGKVDAIIASFSITEERKKQVDFSVPYAVIQSAVATSDGTKITSLKELANKEIAVTRGSTNDLLITQAVKDEGIEGASIMRYDDNAAATNAVLSGQQDIYVVAPSLLVPVNQANPSRQIVAQLVLKTFPLGIGLRKNEPELKAWLDKWVSDNLASGKLSEIYQTYHGQPLPAEMPKG